MSNNFLFFLIYEISNKPHYEMIFTTYLINLVLGLKIVAFFYVKLNSPDRIDWMPAFANKNNGIASNIIGTK